MKRLLLTAMLGWLAASGCDGNLTNPFSQTPSRGQPTEDEDAVTIMLGIFRDPATHARDANHYREMLMQAAGWKDLMVVHKSGHSVLYWGRYADSYAAQDNLNKAKAYRPPSGQPLFIQALVVPYPGKDIGPAEWNLKNVKAHYSLVVAVFKNDPEQKYLRRRHRAVESCRKLREAGYKAYFYHGRAASDVTIGAFGPDSVTARNTPTGTILDITDQRIKVLQAEFPHLLINGNTMADIIRDGRTGKIVHRDIQKTYLIRIPASDKQYVR